jgi:acetyl-CoA carboxylase biotin carboxylase subunit
MDTHIYDQYVVPPFYDSLLAKLIVHGVDRQAAIQRLRRCLDEFVVEGISTNIPFHQKLVEHPDFIAGNVDTGFLARMLEPSPAVTQAPNVGASALNV